MEPSPRTERIGEHHFGLDPPLSGRPRYNLCEGSLPPIPATHPDTVDDANRRCQFRMSSNPAPPAGISIPPSVAPDGGRKASRLEVTGSVPPPFEAVLSEEALQFVAALTLRFDQRRRSLLQARSVFHERLTAGVGPDFLKSTRTIREGDWRVPPPPADLRDRRVEITGPVDRKMIINALNSGARVYMADFEDAHSPTWGGTVSGQANLMDAVRRRIDYRAPDGRDYRLNETTATLMVRPRGLHLEERHVTLDGQPVPASFFDFGLFLFHNAHELRRRGTGSYFYLPKIEHHKEARLWNDVFRFAQEELGLPLGSIRATVLIETLPAVFQMDEILWELCEHSAGLNCGRWDYLFSFIKQFRDDPQVIFPDRAQLQMTAPFLRAYSELLVQTCHRRGAHAMGGMAAYIPVRDDPEANARAFAEVTADKEREVGAGHDGTWVAHPGLVPVAQAVFDANMPGANQIDLPREPRSVTAAQLLAVPPGPVTEAGVRTNVRVALRYLEAWLRGIGCVPIDNKMEDAATVEIARSQLWQWIHHGVHRADGPLVDASMFRSTLGEEASRLTAEQASGTGIPASVRRATAILDEVVTGSSYPEFLIVRAYSELDALSGVNE
jgi:malate synthase